MRGSFHYAARLPERFSGGRSAENLNNVFLCGQSGTFHDGSILSARDSTAEQIAPTVITEVRGLTYSQKSRTTQN